MKTLNYKTILIYRTGDGLKQCENTGTLEERLNWIDEIKKLYSIIQIKFEEY